MARVMGLVFGTFAGMLLGMVVAFGVFVALDDPKVKSANKDPLLFIPLVGCLGGVVGGVLGVRGATESRPRKDRSPDA